MKTNTESNYKRLLNTIVKDIEYYDNYKKSLIQYLIVNCAYASAYSSKKNIRNHIRQRHHLTPKEMLDIIKEILWLEIVLHNLNINKNQL